METESLLVVPLPSGVGAEVDGDRAMLVGDAGDLAELAGSILDGLLARAAALVVPVPLPSPAVPVPRPVVVRLLSPAERGTGQCTMPGCEVPGGEGHVHPGWMVARANGRLTGEVAQRWSVQSWTRFLAAHHISQLEAVQSLRAHASAEGLPVPSGLAAVAGRPDLAVVLLDMADAMLAFATADPGLVFG